MSSLAFSGALVQWRLFEKSLRKRKEPLGGCNLACLNRTMDIRAEVKYVSPKEAKRLVTDEGYTILDVRDQTQYDRAHIKSCHHVPIFIENNDGDFGTVIKRTLHNNVSGLFFGLPFTKSNSDFVPLVQQQFPTDSKLLLVCQEGLSCISFHNAFSRSSGEALTSEAWNRVKLTMTFEYIFSTKCWC
jgi:rhodanese-related sulfurtransferase